MDEPILLFKNKKEPSYIWYADKPPRLGGIPTKISVKEFERIIGDEFQYTENIYLSKKTKINRNNLRNHDCMKEEILEILNNPLNDKLVVCYMGEKVGHGVFALEDIPIGEIIALYTGEVETKTSNFLNDYFLDLDPKTPYVINAKNRGGIARFVQHLPYRTEEIINSSIQTLKQNKRALNQYLKQSVTGDDLPIEYRQQSIEMLRNDILFNNGQDVMKRFLNFLPNREWQLDKISFENRLDLNRIAFLNVSTDFSTIDGKPVSYLWAQRCIKKGEQLGFDYGLSYWIGKDRSPLLFDTSGAIFPVQKYKYTEAPVLFQTSGSRKSIFYSKKNYESDASSQKPLKFELGASTVSFFSVRKHLVENNVLDSCYLPVKEPNSFLLALKNYFGTAYEFDLYERFPENKNDDKGYIFDVVCKASSTENLEKLYKIFEKSPLKNYCFYYADTKEIVIKSVNLYTTEMNQFVRETIPNKSTLTM